MTQEANRRTSQESSPRARQSAERWELLGHLQAIIEPLMIALGVVFLALLLVDFAGFVTGSREQLYLSRTQNAIWVIFVVEFAIRLWIAPDRRRYLRRNWFSAVTLALPFLRPFRALRAVRALRSISLVRLLGGVNRAMRMLRRVASGHVVAYIAALTAFVCLAGASGVWYFDRGVEGSPIQSFGDALWWSAALVTTINNEKFAVSLEARIIAILLRIYAISVFGYITATIASYLIGAQEDDTTDNAAERSVHEELALLRHEIAVLQNAVHSSHAVIENRLTHQEKRSGIVDHGDA